MTLEVVYEDEFFLVINKPAFLESLSDNFSGYILAHRLDKDTSGLLILAKSEGVAEKFQSLFRTREIKKTYLGLFFGRVEEKIKEPMESVLRVAWQNRRSGLITGPIRRSPKNPQKFSVLAEGRASQTGFKVLKYYRYFDQAFSLAEVYPVTGRTHQIRVHLSAMGFPLVGDKIYAPRSLNQAFPFAVRQLLHAKTLSFRHPITGVNLRLEVSLPEDFKRPLRLLRRGSGR